ncbi:class I SAM-dependent methyltransferase [Evansella tamaricis]|uniref:Methyltransferase domain-containing protein n=1 Tax=Evansella tamaricis TaxID=2069301 RepID=A0ABS6JBY8_9BACI|nr:class I SAM-dependent methyltransferase [Evansella tamaricis]MBU9711193.1 methyltransferase domain-containing protein [Evansella tamaricis]
MLIDLYKYLEKPKLFTQSTCEFWNDEHISKGMLEAHLHPNWEAASRCHDFIDQSVEWIAEMVPSSMYPSLLDLGCGPGLYAERLYKKGYDITGIDFSERSITYAKEKASQRDEDIKYVYKNYLNLNEKNEYDVVTLIYCDFAVLSDINRESLLNRIYDALKPGGKFIFDVFTRKEFEDKEENHTWYLSEGSGFWKPDKHLCFQSHYIYEGDVRLDQYVIIDKDGQASIIRNWLKGYSKETITSEVKMAGFQKCDIYSDVTGKPYSDESKTICIVAEK